MISAGGLRGRNEVHFLLALLRFRISQSVQCNARLLKKSSEENVWQQLFFNIQITEPIYGLHGP